MVLSNHLTHCDFSRRPAHILLFSAPPSCLCSPYCSFYKLNFWVWRLHWRLTHRPSPWILRLKPTLSRRICCHPSIFSPSFIQLQFKSFNPQNICKTGTIQDKHIPLKEKLGFQSATDFINVATVTKHNPNTACLLLKIYNAITVFRLKYLAWKIKELWSILFQTLVH